MHRSSDEFWALTPREVFACFDAYAEEQTILNYRAGLPAAAMYNVNRSKKSAKAIQPLDFFGGSADAERSAEEILVELQKATTAMESRGVRVVKKPKA